MVDTLEVHMQGKVNREMYFKDAVFHPSQYKESAVTVLS